MNWSGYFAMMEDWKRLPAYKAEPRIQGENSMLRRAAVAVMSLALLTGIDILAEGQTRGWQE